jgi:hypothetical protein
MKRRFTNYGFTLLLLPLISPLGLEVYGFSILLLEFFLVGKGLLQGLAQAPVGSDHILLVQDPARRGGPHSQLRAKARPQWKFTNSHI